MQRLRISDINPWWARGVPGPGRRQLPLMHGPTTFPRREREHGNDFCITIWRRERESRAITRWTIRGGFYGHQWPT
jgi:hypothetical protein